MLYAAAELVTQEQYGHSDSNSMAVWVEYAAALVEDGKELPLHYVGLTEQEGEAVVRVKPETSSTRQFCGRVKKLAEAPDSDLQPHSLVLVSREQIKKWSREGRRSETAVLYHAEAVGCRLFGSSIEEGGLNVMKGGMVVIQQKSIVDTITMATEHLWQQNQEAVSMISYQACEDKVCSLPALQVMSRMASLGLLAAKEEDSLSIFLCRVVEETGLCHADMWKLENQGIQLSKEIVTLGHLKRAISSIRGTQ